jgi:chemotaxis protein MotA
MDFASLIGIISGLSLIFTAIFIGGDLENFINVPGLMIVLGGTIAATLLTFPIRDVMSSFRAAAFIFFGKKQDPNDMVATMVDLCQVAKRQGRKSLSMLDTDSVFLRKASNMIADWAKEDMLRDALSIEIESLKQRHFIIQEVFKKMALYAPSFGMLGTLIGLIQMLSNLENPETLGPAMAIALLTTFYGILLATLLFNPIAGKLKQRTMLEVVNLEIIFEGAISILKNDNRLLVYEKLSSYIPVSTRRPMELKRISQNPSFAGRPLSVAKITR